MRKLLVLPILLIAAAFPLAGCGGGSSGDEGQITDVIETAATTNADRNCTELQTQRFLEQTQLVPGKAAIEACKRAGPETNADSADISNVEVNGDKATADVALHGSAFDGQTVALSLVKEGDQWKLDHIDDFVNFDQKALAHAFVETARKAKNPPSAAQASCVEGKLAGAPSGAVEQAILAGSSQALVALIGSCFR